MARLTWERLREVLIYYPETGEWERRVRTGNRCTVGRFFGTRNRKDYHRIGVDGVNYIAHRLAWFYMTGKWPAHDIDDARPWSDCAIIPCSDGKARRVESTIFPLSYAGEWGSGSRVGILRGAGNAIVAPVAAEFVMAFLECCP